MVRVRLFAGPRDAVGAGQIDVPLPPGATAAALLEAACAAHPALQRWRPTLQVAVNRRLAGPGDRIGAGDEVALLPPVSGGAVDFGDDLSVDAAVGRLSRQGAGAVVAFLGVARPDGGTVRLDFEAYEEMAVAEMSRIEREATAKFALTGALLRHRLGPVPVGEASILVAVAARHRREAFAAASWIMDEVKAGVPVWKREVGTTSRWVHPER